MSKIALITGANKGIGFETARQLGKKEFIVLIGARDSLRGEQAASDLRKQEIDAKFIQIDPTNPESISAAVKKIENEYGHLDVLINNAGTLCEADYSAPACVPIQTFRDTFEINVFGLHQVTQAF